MTPSLLGAMFGADGLDDSEEQPHTSEGQHQAAAEDTVDLGAMTNVLGSSSVLHGEVTTGAGTADLSALIGALGRAEEDADDRQTAPREAGSGAGRGAGNVVAAGHGSAGKTEQASVRRRASDSFDRTGDTSIASGANSSFSDNSSRASSSQDFTADGEEPSSNEPDGATDDDVAELIAQASVLADSVGDAKDGNVLFASRAARRGGTAAAGPASSPAPGASGGFLDALTPASDAGFAQSGPRPLVGAAAAAACDDMTINTKMAVADLDAMLASPGAGFGTSMKPFVAAQVKPSKSVASTVSTGMSFAIFADDAAAPAAAAQPAKPAPAPWQSGAANKGKRAALGSLVRPDSPLLSPIPPRAPLAASAAGTASRIGLLASASASLQSPSEQEEPTQAAIAALDVSVSTSRGHRGAPGLPSPGLRAPSFAVFDDPDGAAPAAAGASVGDELEVLVDENAGTSHAMPMVSQAEVRSRALGELALPAAPARSMPSRSALVEAASTGGSVDVGDAFVVFEDGLDGAGADQAASNAFARLR
jgi:hypothetical protein